MKYLLYFLSYVLFFWITYSYTCSYNAYNCWDFWSHAEAQGVYEMCNKQVWYDVHWLDDDKDWIACESLKSSRWSYSTYSTPSIVCSSNQCKLNWVCYIRPSNASCVNSVSDAWKCNSWYYESWNSCIKSQQKPSTTKKSSSTCWAWEYERHQIGYPIRCLKLEPWANTHVKLNQRNLNIYARDPIDFTYRNSDKNKHCDHNRQWTSYNYSTEMCICPSWREFWQWYWCWVIKWWTPNSQHTQEVIVSNDIQDRNSLYHACASNRSHHGQVFNNCTCVVNGLQSINLNYDLLLKWYSQDKLNIIIDKVYTSVCS